MHVMVCKKTVALRLVRVQCCSVQGVTRRTSKRDSEANARITSYLHNILIRKDHQDFSAVRVFHSQIRQQSPPRAKERSAVILPGHVHSQHCSCIDGVGVFAREEVEAKRGEEGG